jgi:UDP-N-acetylmuramate dehydrogenase
MKSADWFQENAARFSGELKFNEPLARHTYYRIGGPARVFAAPKRVEDLHWLSEGLRITGLPHFILGAGSNLLASDNGFSGVVVSVKKLNLEIMDLGALDNHRIRCGASVMISSLLRKASQEGWAGFEILAGIPGTVGGAAFMNAGTHLGEAKDLLERVEVFPLYGASSGDLFEPIVFDQKGMKYHYRHNDFIPRGAVVWAVEFQARAGDPIQVKAELDSVLARRKATQPLEAPSCGSVFKNPREAGLHAWQVIDKLELRGHRIGGAIFSPKHCNFILNEHGATAADVRGLIELAKKRASSELGVKLEEEVIYLGDEI